MAVLELQSMKTHVSPPVLPDIEKLDKELHTHFQDKLRPESALSRQMVSFQASKTRAFYRWYKYKEAFSAELAEYLFCLYGITGRLLDPFAGSGTALFAAGAMGIEADGIELLPVGQEIVQTRLVLQQTFESADFARLTCWRETRLWNQSEAQCSVPTLRITEGAYPPETLSAIEKFMGARQQENEKVKQVLIFALLCVLEAVSYTRKDGQYLRWDLRSGRRQGKRPFHKGKLNLLP